MFPCTGCGLCCQNISTVEELKEFDLGNGICKYFDTKTSNCLIYENRPNICKVEKMFDLKYHKFFTKREFYLKNSEVCSQLQEIYSLDKSYKVIIGE